MLSNLAKEGMLETDGEGGLGDLLDTAMLQKSKCFMQLRGVVSSSPLPASPTTFRALLIQGEALHGDRLTHGASEV